MVREAPGKGNGAFALMDIPAGTTILIDTALFMIDKPFKQVKEEDVHNVLSTLTSGEQQAFKSLPIFAPPQSAIFYNKHAPLLGRLSTNQFSPIGGNKCGCFVHASRFNHSCLPNCGMVGDMEGDMPERRCVVYRDILKDEELTFSYFEGLQCMDTAQRETFLTNVMSQPCKCELCTAPRHIQYVSDLRRILIRFLLFFIHNKDWAHRNQPIRDDFRTELEIEANRMGARPGWANLLLVCLAEEEGVLGSMNLALEYTCLLQIKLKEAYGRELTQLSSSDLAYIRRFYARAIKAQRLLPDQDMVDVSTYMNDIAKAVIDQGGLLP